MLDAQAQTHDPRRVPPHAGVVGRPRQYRSRRPIPRGGFGMFRLDSLRQEIDRLATVPLRYSPATSRFTALVTTSAAYLVEHFSGMPYAEYVRTCHSRALGMRRTAFGVPADHEARLRHHLQPRRHGKLVPTPPYATRASRSAPRTLSTSGSAPDYLRFASMLLNGGELDGVRILGRNGRAHGAEPPAAERPLDRRQRAGRDRLRARRLGDDRHSGARPPGRSAASVGAGRQRPRSA